jgi:cytochrome c peroxidase
MNTPYPLFCLRWLLAVSLAALCLVALTACGGGGSDGAPTASTTTTDTVTAEIARAQGLAVQRAGNLAQLGQLLFSDANLSEPRGTACLACHQPGKGFAGNHGSRIGVALGSQAGALGLRNAMTNSYVGSIPPLQFVTANGETEALGGHFWDGRADTLALQALGPLLNPLEMNNANRQAVVTKLTAASYAPLFRQVFGPDAFSDTDTAFTNIGVAIAAFEQAALQPFSSKYDAYVRGRATLSAPEMRGMALFMDTQRANCAGCHLMNPSSGNPQDSLFSEFTYYATGIPRNRAIPRNADSSFYDLGLCGPDRTAPTLPADVASGVTIGNFCGKFRMPTLRNVAERPAFMHNGFFRDLREVVRFYSTRASNPERWYGGSPLPDDLPVVYRGNLEVTKAPFNRAAGSGPLLSDTEVNDIVAFLHTLSDGYQRP